MPGLRIGAEFHDEDDIRYLLRHLAIGSYDQAVAVITRFLPLERFRRRPCTHWRSCCGSEAEFSASGYGQRAPPAGGAASGARARSAATNAASSSSISARTDCCAGA
jgi:hypothetical protein